jgi:hypothetical protein
MGHKNLRIPLAHSFGLRSKHDQPGIPVTGDWNYAWQGTCRQYIVFAV